MSFLLGFVAAFLLLIAQAPDGDGLLEFAGAFGWRTALAAASGLALAACAVAIAPRSTSRDQPRGSLLLGLAAGACTHALLLGWRLPLPAGHNSLASVCAIAVGLAACLLVLRRRDEPADAPRWIGILALAGASAGAAICMQGLGRLALRLGLGDPAEQDWLIATVLTCSALGGLAFGRFLGGFDRDRSRGATAALAMAGAGLGSLLAARAAMLIVTPRGIRTFVRRFGLDLSESGTLLFTGLVGLGLLLGPACFAGTAIYSARGRRALATIALGACLGPLIANLLLGSQGVADLFSGGAGTGALIESGAWICAGSAILLQLPTGGLHLGGRAWGLFCAGSSALILLLTSMPSLPVMRAWNRFPADPVAILEITEGQITVTPDGAGGLQAFLDQRPITGGTPAYQAEFQQVQLAFNALEAEVLQRGVRVLLIGQLDSQRAQILQAAGASRVDRSATWWRAMERVEHELGSAVALDGDILNPLTAAVRIEEEQYDLVLALARPGLTPRIQPTEAPASTRVFRWLDGAAPLAHSPLPERTLLVTSGLQNLQLGLASQLDKETESLLCGLASGGPLPLRRLQRRQWERPYPERSAMLQRLARWNPDQEGFLRALARMQSRQTHSSPFESYAQSIELGSGLTEELCFTAEPHGNLAWVRGTVYALAQVLLERRDIGALLEHVEPLSLAWGRPRELETILAQGDLESLQPEAARQRLEPFLASSRVHPETWRLLANAFDQLGESARAVSLWRDLEATQGLEEAEARRMALAMMRAGDPQGPSRVQMLLRLHPDDEELKASLEVGPVLPGDPTFQPKGDPHDH